MIYVKYFAQYYTLLYIIVVVIKIIIIININKGKLIITLWKIQNILNKPFDIWIC